MNKSWIDYLKMYRTQLLACGFMAQMLATPLADRSSHVSASRFGHTHSGAGSDGPTDLS
jgi:hypothetical protein